MCGIAGLWNVSGGAPPQPALRAMLAAMRHRGPDGSGEMAFAGGAAGMVRLALVDLTERGQQPLWSPDRRVAILFNGEMYNFRAERSRLAAAGYPFQSQTDTEVVLALYLERGPAAVDALRGMFALALFDWRDTAPDGCPDLILARDPFGIKPLYVAEGSGSEGSLVFASELRALLASDRVPRRVAPEALADYLQRGFVVQPRTMIDGVRMLEPGTLVRHRPDQRREARRFGALPAYQPRRESLDEAAQRLRGVLEESVRLHALADAPVGAFLSGGIDSTGIVGLMRRHVSDLRTYTLRFPDLPGNGESELAESAAARFGCRHTTVDVTGDDVARDMPIFAEQLDQPSTDGLNTWLISRAAAGDVKGVLSGLGGDEWFAGYPVVRRMARCVGSTGGRVQSLAGMGARLVAGAAPLERVRSRLLRLAARRSPLAIWLHSRCVFRPDQVARMTHRSAAPRDELERLLSRENPAWRDESPLGLACLLDSAAYMRCQLLRDSDAASMAHSLELRVPLVDREVVAFSRSCDDSWKLDLAGGDGSRYGESGSKRVLIHALRDVLPASIAERPKLGFALPYEQWLRGPIWPLARELCSPAALRRRGLVDPDWPGACHASDPSKLAAEQVYPQLWSLLVLELWCASVLDRKPHAVALGAAG